VEDVKICMSTWSNWTFNRFEKKNLIKLKIRNDCKKYILQAHTKFWEMILL